MGLGWQRHVRGRPGSPPDRCHVLPAGPFTADWARAGHARAPYGVAVILNAMSSLNPGRVIVTPLPARVVTDELVIVVPVAVS